MAKKGKIAAKQPVQKSRERQMTDSRAADDSPVRMTMASGVTFTLNALKVQGGKVVRQTKR